MKTNITSHTIHISLVACLLMVVILLSGCNPAAQVIAAPNATESPMAEPGDNPPPIAAPTLAFDEPATPTIVPQPAMLDYTDQDYHLAFVYPADWSMNVASAGQAVGGGYPASHVVELTTAGYRVLIHIKFYWDSTVVGGALPPGEVQKDGTATLLGQAIDRNQLVYQDATKLVWYAARADELELYIRIEEQDQTDYASITIPGSMIDAVDTMMATFARTGDPVTPPPSPEPIEPAQPIGCSLPTQLNANDWVKVAPGLPNVIRAAPGRGPNSSILGEIPAGMVVRLLEGPVCADGYHWWRVDAGMLSGWAAEGGEASYWLVRVSVDEPVEVDGWVGALISTPEWPQIDDYFQMLNQGGSRYGITSPDSATRQALQAYRDTGTLLRIWGKLYYGRMDAYNSQIEVTRFELFTP
jgi:hypothetical protein